MDIRTPKETVKSNKIKRLAELSIAFVLGFDIALVIALIKTGVFQLPWGYHG